MNSVTTTHSMKLTRMMNVNTGRLLRYTVSSRGRWTELT
jgi:hypothetical protein